MVEPSKEQLFGSISAFLLKGDQVSAKEMKAKILKDHPDWKVSERRVKKYIKRHSKGMKISEFDDESTAVAEGIKSKSFIKRLFQRKRRSSQMVPITVIEEGVLHAVSETDMENGAEVVLKPSEVEGTTADEGKNLDDKVYEEGESENKKDCECNFCVIS